MQRYLSNDTCRDDSLVNLSDEKCIVSQIYREPWINPFSNVHQEQQDNNPMHIPPPIPPPEPQDDSSDNEENGEWYRRNSTALVSYRDLRKLILPHQREGLGFVKSLQIANEISQKNKTNDVTGKRRERKSVLPKETWNTVESELLARGIRLESREKGGQSDGRINATLTYYGTSAVFYNHQVRTKIRMRIRYYVSYEKTTTGTIFNVRREGATKDKGFLELKVKSPRAYDENSVDKYRVIVSDYLIAQLVNQDPTAATFLNDLDFLKQSIQRESKPEKATLIDTIFRVMGTLAMRKPAFIRPSLVISYERSAFKYIEQDYPIPLAATSPTRKRLVDYPIPSRSQRSTIQPSKKNGKIPQLVAVFDWRRRRGRTPISLEKAESTEPVSTDDSDDGIFHDDDMLRTLLLKKPSERNMQYHDIEYQFTIDRNVRAHYPLLPVPGATRMPVAEHFDAINKTELMRYPTEARVVEFKEPIVVAALPEKERSSTHNTLIKDLVDRMQAQIMWGDYDENVGKYGNFRSRLIQEHRTNRIKNEQIQIDFSGTGMYQQYDQGTSVEQFVVPSDE